MIIRRRRVDDTFADFKVCRKRVEQVGRFLIQNHPGFTHHQITFSQINCDLLPEDGVLTNIPTLEDPESFSATDEGAMTRDLLQEDTEQHPPDVAFVITNYIRPPQENEIRNALDPVKWPTIYPEP